MQCIKMDNESGRIQKILLRGRSYLRSEFRKRFPEDAYQLLIMVLIQCKGMSIKETSKALRRAIYEAEIDYGIRSKVKMELKGSESPDCPFHPGVKSTNNLIVDGREFRVCRSCKDRARYRQKQQIEVMKCRVVK